MNHIIKGVSLGKKYTDASVVVVSERTNGIGCWLILIHTDAYGDGSTLCQTPDKDIHIVHLSEGIVINSLLDDRGRIISRFFNNPIVIKDDLHIVPLIMEIAQGNDYASRLLSGNLVVRFREVNDSHLFYTNTLIQLFGVVGTYLGGANAFALFSANRTDASTVYACWDLQDENANHIGLMRHVVRMIPEINLHAMRINYYPVSSRRISCLQKWSTSFFLPLFANSNENDSVIREVFHQYLAVAKKLFDSPLEFVRQNKLVLKETIHYSISSMSQKATARSLKGEIMSKLLSEYNKIVKKNYDALLCLMMESCIKWSVEGEKSVPIDVSMELDTMREEEGNDVLYQAYDTIFSCSLAHAFHFAFFPYCISEFLPIIYKI